MPEHRGRQLLGLAVDQHDATAIGFDPLEDQFQDALEQLVDVQGMTDGQRRAVHHLQVAAGAGQPGTGQRIVVRKDATAFLLLTDEMMREPSSRALVVDDGDLLGQVDRGLTSSPVKIISVLPTSTRRHCVTVACSMRSC